MSCTIVSCRLVAGMHSTSFVLGKGVGCLRFLFCELVSNSYGLLARAWCLLSASFVVNSRHCTAAFTAGHWYASSIVGTRKPQVRLQTELSGDSAAVPRTKGKEFFSRVTQWPWRSCEPQDDNRSHHPSDMRSILCMQVMEAGMHV